MDLLLLLTRREGFGQVVVEAAACGVPAVTTRVSGTVDSVVDGVTGRLVPLGDVEATVAAVLDYLASDALRATTGEAARARAVAEFGAEHLDGLWADFADPASSERAL